jgi:hypothetical protein
MKLVTVSLPMMVLLGVDDVLSTPPRTVLGDFDNASGVGAPALIGRGWGLSPIDARCSVGDHPAGMDASARRNQSERNRRRLPPRRGASLWARRIAGLLATAALLGTGVAAGLMVVPDGGEESVAEASPAATPKPKQPKAKTSKPKKPKGPTKAQLAARREAVAEVRRQGFTTLKVSDYDPKATLRVLIGRPVGDAAGGHRAFFFERTRFLGNDAAAPSSKLSVARRGKLTVTLSYGVYATGDNAGQPSGRKRVRFRLEGVRIHALDTIPFDTARFQRRTG